ncbi:hypothetical protein NHX12_014153 [Muraenolepis orangiensis]|uniref:Uncharacterized protein n=1 Tax=Muraenolepis orangiensis TaxID=630683 RepID=A0A9Q0DBL6_9TELE|nr:hypothetical protein NHX12_014153 [Muraenolepis orangiensis]
MMNDNENKTTAGEDKEREREREREDQTINCKNLDQDASTQTDMDFIVQAMNQDHTYGIATTSHASVGETHPEETLRAVVQQNGPDPVILNSVDNSPDSVGEFVAASGTCDNSDSEVEEMCNYTDFVPFSTDAKTDSEDSDSEQPDMINNKINFLFLSPPSWSFWLNARNQDVLQK